MENQLKIEENSVAPRKSNRRTKIGIGIFLALVLAILIAIPILITTYKPNADSSVTTPQPTTSQPNKKKPYNLDLLKENEKSRINCFLEEESQFEKLTRYQCESRGCIYEESEYERVPTCYYDRQNLGYVPDVDSSDLSKPIQLKLKENQTLPYIGAFKKLTLTVQYYGNNMINVKISPNEERYEVPYELKKNNPVNSPPVGAKAKFEFQKDPKTGLVSFKIVRDSDKQAIFDTSFGGFVFLDQFIQISTHLMGPIYGFGENNHESLKHDYNYRSWGIFARDNAPGWGDNRNLYGAQPVYLGMEKSGKSHLVLLYNSNSMEYLFTPAPSLTLRSIGGILDFYFIVDEKPDLVLQTYHQLIGLPVLPPYWSFGFQISRWGYENLSDVQQVIERTRAIDLPHDVQYIDIEYMIGYRILTVDPINYNGLGTYMKKVREDGLKLVLIVDPGLVIERNNTFYMTGVEKDIYVKWPKNLAPYDKDCINPDCHDVISWCWPNGKISYPDYMNDKTHLWWEDSLRAFMADEKEGCDMDGIWIDMNEPSSFETNELKPWNWLYPENDTERYPYFSLKCPTSKLDDPPYRTKSAFVFDSDNLLAKKARLSQKTLCMINKHEMNGKQYYHYDVHNLYAHSQAVATYKAFANIKSNLRPFSLTRSNFVGTGHYAVHWLGDNDATWKHMKMSIIGVIEYNIFGIPMVGADICGFFIDIRDAEMCTRWLQVGSFYSFTRNHNANKQQDKDPASFKNKTLEDSTRNVLKIRYTLLPYIYTQFYHVYQSGGSVIKSLFFEFPTDNNTWSIDEQFMFGPGVLVSPVLEPGKTQVKAYLPDARWYDYRTGAELKVSNGQWANLSAPLEIIPIHLRGGYILPTQDPKGLRNTTFTRKNPLGLIVSLDKDKKAEGDLFWDDGVSFNFLAGDFYYAKFKFENNILEVGVENNLKAGSNLVFDDVKIYGIEGSIKNYQLVSEGSPIDKNDFNQTANLLHLFNINISIEKLKQIKLQF